jgi:hypothetical protein
MGRAFSMNGEEEEEEEEEEKKKKKKNAYRILVGKARMKEQLGRPRRRWVDNIEMDLREIGWGGIE